MTDDSENNNEKSFDKNFFRAKKNYVSLLKACYNPIYHRGIGAGQNEERENLGKPVHLEI